MTLEQRAHDFAVSYVWTPERSLEDFLLAFVAELSDSGDAQTSPTADELRAMAFKLSPKDQYRLAFFVAENVGYVLAREPNSHSPAASDNEPIAWRILNLRTGAEMLRLNRRDAEESVHDRPGWSDCVIEPLYRRPFAHSQPDITAEEATESVRRERKALADQDKPHSQPDGFINDYD